MAKKRRKKATKKRTHKKRATKRRTTKRKTTHRKKAVKKRKGKKRRGGGGLVKQKCQLSSSLQEICRGNNISRPEIMKRVWGYIKSHKCQDMKNRRMINPDKKLSAIIGNRPCDMLKLAGHISKHIKK